MTPEIPTRCALEEEAYQHGRTQGRLSAARGALKSILKRVERRNDSVSLAIAASARFALLTSKLEDE